LRSKRKTCAEPRDEEMPPWRLRLRLRLKVEPFSCLIRTTTMIVGIVGGNLKMTIDLQ